MGTVTVRFNEDEGGVLARAAAAAGLSVGRFVKRAALDRARAVVELAEVGPAAPEGEGSLRGGPVERTPARVAAAPSRPAGSAGCGAASAPPTDATGVVPGPSSLLAGPAPLEELVAVVAARPPFSGRFAPRAEALRWIRSGRVRVAGVVVREERVLVDPGEVVV